MRCSPFFSFILIRLNSEAESCDYRITVYNLWRMLKLALSRDVRLRMPHDRNDEFSADSFSVLSARSGAQGEYTGLRAIMAYLEANGQGHRRVSSYP